LVFAIDSRAGSVAVNGWQDQTGLTPFHMIQMLEPWCSAFLYTHIDTEGMMQGIPLDIVRQLRSATQQRLFVAGGISSQREIEELNGLNVDAVVGMAIYTSRLKV
jgi:phosphoribosylformimino-5-aminoimidazole carboxamide ribotide isomerase